jgi:23S rRNA pseudouridine2605 synthase
MKKNQRINRRKNQPHPKRKAEISASRGDNEKRLGLARAISKLGYCSRSQAAELIRSGRVLLNGTVKRDPETPVLLTKGRIEIDGAAIRAAAKVYLVLNKPRGIVTTASDEKGRDTVYSLLSRGLPWVAPVGRLDQASEGLLLLTNDSEWAARITAPETHLDKIYHVQIAVLADEALLKELEKGFAVADGEFLHVKRAELLRKGEKNSWLEITLDEGRNRHIRRMFEQRNIEVLRLIRVAIGPLALADLPKGIMRALTPAEKLALDHAMQRNREATL